jgi:hypothetical protein
MARAMWKRKQSSEQLPKVLKLIMSPIPVATEVFLNGLPDDIRTEEVTRIAQITINNLCD